MEENAVVLQNRGMWQDAAISRTPNEYAYENHNIRISSIEGGTELIVTNEKGWREFERCVDVTYLGSCQISNYLVIFCKGADGTDKIIRYSFDGDVISTKVLYSGNLNFVVPEGENKNIIECIPWYESEDIQKVYWVDGTNCTRVINIVGEIEDNNDDQFDISAKIDHIPSVRIKKDYKEPGLFAQGTIQYFITYYKKYGSETPIVWFSSLQYISFSDRGAKADENVSCGFKISINNIDYSYDYIRVYAASRTSNDSAVSLRVVGDIEIPDKINGDDPGDKNKFKKIYITDYGTTGYAVDSSILQYIGGQDIVASTIAQKDGVMFLGDINSVGSSGVSSSDFSELKRLIENTILKQGDNKIRLSTLVSFDKKKIKAPERSGYYSHRQEIDQSELCVKTFKYRQLYRFALQFMNKSGQWTDPIWCGDLECNKYPEIGTNKKRENGKEYEYKYEGYYLVPTAQVYLNSGIKNFIENKYISYRLLCADLDATSRNVVAQGIVCPTVFNFYDRASNAPYAMSSWTFRPRNSAIANRHYENIGVQTNEYAEIQGVTEARPPFIKTEYKKLEEKYSYWSLIMGFDGGHEIQYRLIFFNLEDKDIYDTVTNKNYKITDCTAIGAQTIENTTKWSKALNWAWDTMTSGGDVPFSRDVLPSPSDAKKVISTLWSSETGSTKIMTELALEDISIDNADSVIRNQISELSKIQNYDTRAISLIVAILGGGYVKKATKYGVGGTSPIIEYPLSKKGWLYIGDSNEANSNYFPIFNGIAKFGEFKGNKRPNGSVWVTGGRLSKIDADQRYIEESKDQFFVDESIVTLNSPDIIDNELINSNESLMFRIVGTIPVSAVYNDFLIETEAAGHSKQSSVIKYNYENVSSIGEFPNTGLYNGYFYQDGTPEAITNGIVGVNDNSYDSYKVFMWNRETSLSLGGGANGLPSDVRVAPLRKKIFANIRYSYNTKYGLYWSPSNGILKPVVYRDDNNLNILAINKDKNFYSGYYDNIITFNTPYTILSENSSFEGEQFNSVKISDPVRMKFSSTEHAIISFNNNGDKTTILPRDTRMESIKDRLSEYDSTYKVLGADENEYGAVEKQYYIVFDESASYPTDAGGYSRFMRIDLKSKPSLGSVYKSDDKVFFSANEEYFYSYYNGCIFNNEGEHYDGLFEETTITSEEIKNALHGAQAFGLILIPINYYLDNAWHYGIMRLGNPPTKVDIQPWEIKELAAFENIKFKKIVIHKDDEGTDSEYGVYRNHCCLMDNRKYVVQNYAGIAFNSVIEEYNQGLSINEDYVWLEGEIDKSQYMFIGELYRNFAYNMWLGGYSENALKLIDWNICSSNTNINKDIKVSWGDTYYQRWDCLKTYPSTEEDKNSVVDIFSFMVETYKNLDGRCDVNRGLDNILTARPSNWNLMNDSYSQNNNVFRYKILDEKFNARVYKNQITWSQKKVNLSDIDAWTNINLASTLSLDGRYGSITKLDTVNNTVVAFQEKAINAINFNARTQLSTEQGLPVEIANSGKVDGYTVITDTSGCQNKFSLIHGGAGIYYMDDLTRSFMRFGKDGIENLGIKYGMSSLFKDNSVLRSVYDRINNDVYIILEDDKCIDFCEKTNSFTAFMPYSTLNKLENINGYTYGIMADLSDVIIVRMFAGKYGMNIFSTGGAIEFYYSMEFDINNEPFLDKVFTSIEYSADVFNNDGSLFVQGMPFTSINAKNEYQEGNADIYENPATINNANQFRKFRIRRVDIPRDRNSRFGLDRIRSQWCRIKLSGVTTDMQMKFHQASVRYFK